MIDVTRYDECLEVFRSEKFGARLADGEEPFLGGAMGKSNPPEHTARRRVLNRLTKHDGFRWFRERALIPTIPRVLALELDELSSDGLIRTDLVRLARRVQVQLVAAIVGLQQVDSMTRTDELGELLKQIESGFKLQFAQGDRAGIVPRALAAKQQFVSHFYRPSLEEHEAAFASYEEGKIQEEELPRDLMTLLVSKADPRWQDPEVALRDTIGIAVGVVENSVQLITFAFDELETRFRLHADERPLSSDRSYLLRSIEEVLRLHPVNPAQFRLALEDVVLVGGTKFCAGQAAALRVGIANKEQGVFGADAGEFNPHRKVPSGAKPYGLAFGSGPHLCYGLPLVLGAEGVDGAAVHVLACLYAAGPRRDPDRPPVKTPNHQRDIFETYPIILEVKEPSNAISSRDP